MCVIKEWFGKGGSLVARFYSCEDNGGNRSKRYFLDFNGCLETVSVTEVTSANFRSVVALLRTQGVGNRYIKYILGHFGIK